MNKKINRKQANIDSKVVEDFGKEWEAFNQEAFIGESLESAFNQYFCIFPMEKLNTNSVGFDMGCGSGRWAKLIAPKVKQLNCIDPSNLALEQAKKICPNSQTANLNALQFQIILSKPILRILDIV